ncbi:hypothetical protein, partial [Mycobacterium sp. shizuoka-1]|uniref:hypothetical protein n=1 Tax=Mycobacterium sp. shizuoka-1 TaxID=2039281 RepID=UPI000C0717ED
TEPAPADPGAADPAAAEIPAAEPPAVEATTEVPVDPATIVRPPVSWRQFGLADKIVLVGSTMPNEAGMPVPPGISSSMVTGQIGSVVNVASGRVDVVDSRGIVLGEIPVPAGTSTAPFAIDTTQAMITDGVAKLSFVLHDDNPPGNSCAVPPSVTLSQLATTFVGQSPAPTAVSDYRPGYLSRFVLWVGPDAPKDVQQAALSLDAKLSSLYRPMPVRIDIDTAEQPTPVDPTDTRLIEFRPDPKPGLTVRDPGTPNAALVISGQDSTLQNQVALFTDRRIDLAQGGAATVNTVIDTMKPSTNLLTFGQLGMTSQVSVLGTATLYTAFDATAFGVGPIQGAQLHLIARYTPIAAGSGSVVLRSGSTQLASHTLDSSGRLDITADVPADVISSQTGLALDVQYSPKQDCAPLSDRLTFALDPSSTVSVTPGTGNRGGFPALPMAFTPEFSVTLGDAESIRYAAQAINLMGQSTDTPLRPVIRPMADAVKSGSALLVVGDSQQVARSGLKAPVTPGETNSVTVNGDPVTAVNLDGPLGVIQAFTDHSRPVLAVTANGDWTLVDRGFDYIRSQDNRWSSLSGDVIATGAKNVTVNLTVREGGPMAPRPVADPAWQWWIWLSGGALAVALVAAAGLIVYRRRRVGS